MNAGTQRWRVALAVALLTVVGIALVGCGNGDDDDAGDDAANGVTEITVVASDSLAFEPPEIRVRADQRYRLVLDNSDGTTLHDFDVVHMAAQDVHQEGAEHGGHGGSDSALHMAAEAGHMATVEFTPTEPGEYRFACTVPGHAEGGMVGTIIVE